jgi:predicted O-methyltransferase YrrM
MPETDKRALSHFILKQLVPIVGVWPYPLDELMLLCSTVAYFKPQIIIEWGTHIGCSARIFYETVQYLKLSTEVHSVDLPPEVEHGQNLHDVKERGQLVKRLGVHLHLGDGLDVAKSILSMDKSTLFFLDGDHSYASVWRELNGARDLTSQAVVLVHDAFYQGPESGYNCDPYQALTRFCKTQDLPVYVTSMGLPGMGLTYWGYVNPRNHRCNLSGSS